MARRQQLTILRHDEWRVAKRLPTRGEGVALLSRPTLHAAQDQRRVGAAQQRDNRPEANRVPTKRFFELLILYCNLLSGQHFDFISKCFYGFSAAIDTAKNYSRRVGGTPQKGGGG